MCTDSEKFRASEVSVHEMEYQDLGLSDAEMKIAPDQNMIDHFLA